MYFEVGMVVDVVVLALARLMLLPTEELVEVDTRLLLVEGLGGWEAELCGHAGWEAGGCCVCWEYCVEVVAGGGKLVPPFATAPPSPQGLVVWGGPPRDVVGDRSTYPPGILVGSGGAPAPTPSAAWSSA